jgi:hypothetical protein
LFPHIFSLEASTSSKGGNFYNQQLTQNFGKLRGEVVGNGVHKPFFKVSELGSRLTEEKLRSYKGQWTDRTGKGRNGQGEEIDIGYRIDDMAPSKAACLSFRGTSGSATGITRTNHSPIGTSARTIYCAQAPSSPTGPFAIWHMHRPHETLACPFLRPIPWNRSLCLWG